MYTWVFVFFYTRQAEADYYICPDPPPPQTPAAPSPSTCDPHNADWL